MLKGLIVKFLLFFLGGLVLCTASKNAGTQRAQSRHKGHKENVSPTFDAFLSDLCAFFVSFVALYYGQLREMQRHKGGM